MCVLADILQKKPSVAPALSGATTFDSLTPARQSKSASLCYQPTPWRQPQKYPAATSLLLAPADSSGGSFPIHPDVANFEICTSRFFWRPQSPVPTSIIGTSRFFWWRQLKTTPAATSLLSVPADSSGDSYSKVSLPQRPSLLHQPILLVAAPGRPKEGLSNVCQRTDRPVHRPTTSGRGRHEK